MKKYKKKEKYEMLILRAAFHSKGIICSTIANKLCNKFQRALNIRGK